jgi:hypothetical protein
MPCDAGSLDEWSGGLLDECGFGTANELHPATSISSHPVPCSILSSLSKKPVSLRPQGDVDRLAGWSPELIASLDWARHVRAGAGDRGGGGL